MGLRAEFMINEYVKYLEDYIMARPDGWPQESWPCGCGSGLWDLAIIINFIRVEGQEPSGLRLG